jgi:hypothetical protein
LLDKGEVKVYPSEEMVPKMVTPRPEIPLGPPFSKGEMNFIFGNVTSTKHSSL